MTGADEKWYPEDDSQSIGPLGPTTPRERLWWKMIIGFLRWAPRVECYNCGGDRLARVGYVNRKRPCTCGV